MQDDEGKSLCARSFRCAFLLIVTTLLLGLGTAHAVDVACDGDTTAWTEADPSYSDAEKLSNAFLSDTTVNVTGPCNVAPRGLTIQSLKNLTISGDDGSGDSTITPTEVIGLPLAGSCPPDAPAAGFFNRPVLTITDSRGITLRGLIIEGGNQGLSSSDSQVTLRGVTVEDVRGNGINLGDSSINLQGAFTLGATTITSANTVQNNCSAGISAGTGSSVGINTWNTISGNGGAGISVGNGSSANLNACCLPNTDTPAKILIQNNFRGVTVNNGGSASINGGPGTTPATGIHILDSNEWGVSVFDGGANLNGQTIVQNNMTGPFQSTVAAGREAGVAAQYGGRVFVSDGTQILGNHGAGILADFQAIVRLGSPPPMEGTPPFTGITVSGNAAEGVKLLHMSIGESLPDNTISGNLGSADATCDGSSWLVGDTTGIATIKCANTEQTKKK